ncbi:MAG: hypothetical protein ACI9RU_000749 [Litorivivens sp.]|jgi:hypothetical protein
MNLLTTFTQTFRGEYFGFILRKYEVSSEEIVEIHG